MDNANSDNSNSDDTDLTASAEPDEIPNADRGASTSVQRSNGDTASTQIDSQTESTEAPTGSTNAQQAGERLQELQAELETVRDEKTTLSEDYARARTTSYRKTGQLLAVVGAVAVLGGVALADVRPVLFVIGSIGLFGSILTWFLTPERVVPISVSESVYDAAATTLVEIRDELGLQSVTVYVPAVDTVRGFIPRHRAFEPPEDMSYVFANTDDASRGVTFTPSGKRLVTEFELMRSTRTPDSAVTATEQLANALVEHFEIASSITVEGDESSRLTVSVQNAAFGPLTQVDHPILSALACEIVQTTERPVTVELIDEETATLEIEPSK